MQYHLIVIVYFITLLTLSTKPTSLEFFINCLCADDNNKSFRVNARTQTLYIIESQRHLVLIIRISSASSILNIRSG